MSSETYNIFGLVIESELPFPHWPKHSTGSEPHVFIKHGTISREWDQRTPSERWYLVDGNQVFIRINAVGRFLISNGDSVIFEPGGNSPHEAWLYVEGVITGAILHQRRIWPLHGSAVLRPDGCVAAFIGQRGIGKSTLLFELQNRGHAVVADDIAAITFDSSGQPIVHPGFPQGKLCVDAVENFGLDVNQLNPLLTSQNKFAVKFEKLFSQTQRPLAEIFVLERTDSVSLECHELAGLDKLRQLSDNTYRLELLSTDEDYQQLFKNILNATKYLHAYALRRPAEGNSVRELANLIEERWNRLA